MIGVANPPFGKRFAKQLCRFVVFIVRLAETDFPNIGKGGCQYQGASLHGKPNGQGALTCADGRVYTGAFKNGQFHGKGQYVVPNRHSLMLAPFNMNSDKLRNMVLTGTFVNGLANGKFKVFQEGKHVFNMQFDRGIVTNMTLPQKR